MSQTLTFVAAMAVLLNIGCTNRVGDSPQFKITTKRDHDKVEVQIANGKAVFSIHSPFGISQAVVERLDEKWPDAVALQLYLQGLENFKIANGNVTLEATVSSQKSKQPVRLWKDGDAGLEVMADCRVSCEHLPVPASRDSSGVTDHSPVSIAVAGFVCTLGILAYHNIRRES